MITLESYALGGWRAGEDEGRTLDNPATEEALARCSTAGIDFAAVLAHAREAGGPALRALGFQRRGELLKALSGVLHGHRDELLDLSIQNGGNTRGDAKFDVDGAIGTLAAYAGFAKALDGRTFLSDGEGTQLGRTKRYWGQHIQVPREGAAIHINAFNFPAWGMGEKMAQRTAGRCTGDREAGHALGSCSPTASRRSPSTAASCPRAPSSSSAAATGDLLDHLGPLRTSMSFTGSSGTAAMLKANAQPGEEQRARQPRGRLAQRRDPQRPTSTTDSEDLRISSSRTSSPT